MVQTMAGWLKEVSFWFNFPFGSIKSFYYFISWPLTQFLSEAENMKSFSRPANISSTLNILNESFLLSLWGKGAAAIMSCNTCGKFQIFFLKQNNSDSFQNNNCMNSFMIKWRAEFLKLSRKKVQTNRGVSQTCPGLLLANHLFLLPGRKSFQAFLWRKWFCGSVDPTGAYQRILDVCQTNHCFPLGSHTKTGLTHKMDMFYELIME